MLQYAVTDPRCPVRLVLTLRADFYDRPLRHGAFARLIEPSVVAVTALAPDELESAIVAPAAASGAEFEPGLVSEIVADVGDQPGALPLLQYALTELYERRVSGLLTRDAYRSIGGVAGALAGRAEALLEEWGPADQAAARRIFGRLVSLGEGTEDTRRRALRSELGSDPATERVVAGFGAARLLSFDRDPATREPTVEVAHEALIRSWPRLRRWLDDDRDDLRTLRHLHESAAAWEARGRDDADVYRGGRLDSALEWVGRRPGETTAIEAEFLAAGTRRRDADLARERLQLRRLRRLLTAVAAVAVIAVLAGSLAAVQQRRATRNAAEAAANAAKADANAAEAETNADTAARNAAEAETARDAADVGRLSAEAAARVDDDRQLALVLAAEAFRQERTVQTYGALQRVLSSTGPFLGAFGAGRSFNAVHWTGDGNVVAIGAEGVGTYDPNTGRELSWVAVPTALRSFQYGDGTAAQFALGATGGSMTTAVVGPDKRTLSLIDADGATGSVFVHPANVDAVAVSPGGTRAATLDLNGVLRIFEVASKGLLREIAAHPEPTYTEQLPPGVRFISHRAPQSLATQARTRFGRSALEFRGETELISSQGISVRKWDLGREGFTADGRGMLLMAGTLVATVPHGVLASEDGATFAWFDATRLSIGEFAPVAPLMTLEVPGTGTNWSTPKVLDFAWTADGLLLLSNDGRLIASTITGELSAAVPSGVRDAVALAVNADKSRVVVAGASGLAVHSLDGSQLIARAGPRDVADTFTLSPSGERVVISSGNVYRMPDRPLLDVEPGRLAPSPESATDLQVVVTDGALVLANSPFASGRIDLLDPTTLAKQVSLENNAFWQAFTGSADGRWLAVGEAGDVSVFETATGKRVATFKSGVPTNSTLSFHPDSSRIFATFRRPRARGTQRARARLDRDASVRRGQDHWRSLDRGQTLAAHRRRGPSRQCQRPCNLRVGLAARRQPDGAELRHGTDVLGRER